MKLSISLISLVFISMLGLHQPAKAEEVFFHLNKPLYVEGEDLLFKIYSPERINSNNVQQILISLYSPDGSITIGTPIINSFKNGTVDGKFKLPEIKYEGKYLLRAFFNDMVYTIAIPIYKKSLPDDFVYSELDQETLISETVSDKIEITPKQGWVRFAGRCFIKDKRSGSC